MPREPARDELEAGGGRSAAGVSRFALAGLPELHGMPSKDPRQPRGQEPPEMMKLLVSLISVCVAAMAQSPPAQPASTPPQPSQSAPPADPAAQQSPTPRARSGSRAGSISAIAGARTSAAVS